MLLVVWSSSYDPVESNAFSESTDRVDVDDISISPNSSSIHMPLMDLACAFSNPS